MHTQCTQAPLEKSKEEKGTLRNRTHDPQNYSLCFPSETCKYIVGHWKCSDLKALFFFCMLSRDTDWINEQQEKQTSLRGVQPTRLLWAKCCFMQKLKTGTKGTQEEERSPLSFPLGLGPALLLICPCTCSGFGGLKRPLFPPTLPPLLRHPQPWMLSETFHIDFIYRLWTVNRLYFLCKNFLENLLAGTRKLFYF